MSPRVATKVMCRHIVAAAWAFNYLLPTVYSVDTHGPFGESRFTRIISMEAPVKRNVSMLPPAIQAALDYEHSSWATGSVFNDTVFLVPEESATLSAGTLLKLEEDSNATAFTLPPITAISRFMYQSKTLNGSLVPVSAYILWPQSPQSQADGYQVVAWAHGTIGINAECAPSHFRNLWQHFLAPYQLVLQGYVVVATDYAGLGVSTDSLGRAIVHEYLANPAAA